MLELDHITVIAPNLSEGIAHVRDCLGLDMPPGGRHPQMGTHNHLLRLGDDLFLEVIAVNPDAPPPTHRRWFGLDEVEAVQNDWDVGRRLRGWVARTDELDHVLEKEGDLLGQSMNLSRGTLTWQFAVRPDGALSLDGALPSVMNWGAKGCPAQNMPDLGVRLVRFTLEHPTPERVREHYQRLGIQNAPVVLKGDVLRYRAEIDTPNGIKILF